MKLTLTLPFIILVLFGCSEEVVQLPNDQFTYGKDSEESFDIISMKEDVNTLEATFSMANFVYNFKVKKVENTYHSTFRARSISDSSSLTIEYDLNPSNPKWELNQEEKVLAVSEQIDANTGSAVFPFLKYVKAIDNFLMYTSMSLYSKSKISLIAYHRSILNVSDRRLTKNAGCTVYPFFLLGKSVFRCQEDVTYSRKSVKEAIDINAKKGRDVSEMRNALQNSDNEEVLFRDLYFPSDLKVNFKRFIQQQKSYQDYSKVLESLNNVNGNFEFSIDYYKDVQFTILAKGCNCSGPCGSTLGCCGNYSGCCIVWSNLCLIHDLECLKCDKWHCGWACKPEVQEGGVVESVPEPVLPIYLEDETNT